MKKILIYLFAFLFICTTFSGCLNPAKLNADLQIQYAAPKEIGTIEKTYIYNGTERGYILYIPEDLPENAPIVMGLHGYSSSAQIFKNRYGWDELAEEYKFIMCYPQGTENVYDGKSHWNSRLLISTVDDVGFLSALALDLADDYNLDKNRIFAAGFSNGGYMCYTLACERPDVFRAVASVSGLMSSYTWNNYNQYNISAETWLELSVSVPIPVCHIHGTADSVICIDGSTPYEMWSGGPDAYQTAEFWAGINGCDRPEVTKITENVTAVHYTNESKDTQVWLYEYKGWEHYWPSKDYIVNKPSEINAQDIIWEFFSLY